MTTIQHMRASAFTWALLNPILADKEIGAVRWSDRFKLGDGVTPWNDLPYYETTASILLQVENYYHGVRPFQPYATADRPWPPDHPPGTYRSTYYDTDLGIPAWSDGTDWRDAAGNII